MKPPAPGTPASASSWPIGSLGKALIEENLATINSRIREAARKSGRGPGSIQLVAVSKQISLEKIRQAVRAGIRLFGENKVQEARQKIDELAGEGVAWHFIGHLQKNKVKYIFGRFELIHSVDSAGLAERIHHESRKRGAVTEVLIQVNLSGEESKFGVAGEGLEPLLVSLAGYTGIRARGLMTIPPWDPDPEASRKYFVRLRELRDKINRRAIENIHLDHLSMGMSNDFPVAVEEGATLVRVGTALFGPRP